ncbi:ABC transporter ATP-binding protein [Clostridia bacterium]|nr:ABC transporter ATP-binding protein [Clostridia bacterium]
MIEIKNVVKYFDELPALNGLTLTVPPGSVYGLVGPNGSGKSTIIRHISGAYRPGAGDVRVLGEPVYENPAIKAKIAYVPDDLFHYASATVNDLKKLYKGVYPQFDEERYAKLGQLFNIDPKRAIRKLSKGMQKQVFFWVALCTRPEVVVLDEPVDGLDPVMRRGVWSVLLETVAENNVTVLVSSHNLRELEDVCDHVGIMHKGKMLLERGLSELQDGVVKIQIALPDGRELPEGLNILHRSDLGRVKTLIARGAANEITAALKAAEPILLEVVPLTLEEIFLYELGGEGYANILG